MYLANPFCVRNNEGQAISAAEGIKNAQFCQIVRKSLKLRSFRLFRRCAGRDLRNQGSAPSSRRRWRPSAPHLIVRVPFAYQIKNADTGWGETCIKQDGSQLTILRIAPRDPWTLPRSKNCLPALNFCTSAHTGAVLSSPSFRRTTKKSRYL